VADAGAMALLPYVPSAIMLAYCASLALLTFALAAVVVADACTVALLAYVPDSIMLAYRAALALLAFALLAVVFEDACALALLALVLAAVVVADAFAFALFAFVLFSVVFADAGASTVFTDTPTTIVGKFALWWSRHGLAISYSLLQLFLYGIQLLPLFQLPPESRANF
jgi:hypothetical protein